MAKKLKVKPKTKAKTNKYTGNRDVASAQVVYGDQSQAMAFANGESARERLPTIDNLPIIDGQNRG